MPAPSEKAPAAVTPAPSGWRVVYFLRKVPWVREEPIAAFCIEDGDLGYPMVLDRYRSFVVKVDEKSEYAIAAPGEAAERFVDEAKESARQHRAWLRATRDKRKQEREAEQVLREFAARKAAFEASGRQIPSGHPARSVLGRLSWGLRRDEDDAAAVGLVWFLVDHCEFASGEEVVRTAFEKRLGEFLGAYDLEMPAPALIAKLMGKVKGVEPVRSKGKIDGWTGLKFRRTPPAEACVPDPDDYNHREAAAGVFIAHCIRRNLGGAGPGASPHRMLVVYRAWCIGYRLRPWSFKELARALRPWVSQARKKNADGERPFEGVYLQLPEPGQRVLGRPARGGMSGSGLRGDE